jgi:hypothetical protein
MQVFGNVATTPEKVKTKSTGRDMWRFRVAESHRGLDCEPTWYSILLTRESDPHLAKGDFVKVTGRLKTDFYLSKMEGKPTGTLVIIAFEASKIAKPLASAVPSEKVETVKPVPAPAQAASNVIEWQD